MGWRKGKIWKGENSWWIRMEVIEKIRRMKWKWEIRRKSRGVGSKRLEKLAMKIYEQKKTEEEIAKQQEKQRKLEENFVLDKDGESDYEQPANFFDDDSLYDQEDESISDDSREGFNKKRKRNKKRENYNSKREIIVKNKLFDNLYQDESDDDKLYVDRPCEEISIDVEDGLKAPKTDFKFNSKINAIKKSDESVILTDIWKKLSKNKLAEMGMEFKLNVDKDHCDLNQVQKSDQPELPTLTPIAVPEIIEDDKEIEFIDPDRLKNEQAEEIEQNEVNLDEKKAPVIIGQSLTKNKRSKYIQELVMKSRKTCTLNEIKMMNKETSLTSKKKEENIPQIDQEELERQLIKEADNYINQEEFDDEKEDQIDYKRILELEGDEEGEQDNWGEGELNEEAEGEGDKNDENNQDNEENEQENQQQNNPKYDDEADLESLSQKSDDKKEKFDPVKQAENLRLLQAKINKRKLAVKFFEDEAELGSDHEENDEGQKNINANDYEEILDKKLELMDGDLKDLIDNEEVDSDSDIGAKLLQDHIEDDKKHTMNIIKAMAMKSRYRAGRSGPEIEEENDEEMWNRMRQKKIELEQQEAPEVVQERIKAMCENEGLDDDEKQRIIDEEMRRKIRRNMKIARKRYKNKIIIWD